MTLQLPKVYPITDRSIASLTHSEQVRRLIAGGATLVQLREKNDVSGTFYQDACAALQIARNAGTTLIVNDRVDVALAIGADGVHLGQADLPVIAARKLLGSKAIIGYSTHTLDQVKAALDLPIDYVAFGPIFKTSSKINPDPIVGVGQLREAKSIAGALPLVGIGGIQGSNLAQVLSAGADSAAIISEILKTPENITNNFKNLLLETSPERC
jgi:thiamine-phosphate pyrophosphorylase